MPPLPRKILLFNTSYSISLLLITQFITLYLLIGESGITGVAKGAILMFILTLLGFYCTNLLTKYFKFSHKTPIVISWIVVLLIALIFFFFPQWSRFAYGLHGLNIGFYRSGLALINLYDVHHTVRPKYLATQQALTGILGIWISLLCGFLFRVRESPAVYQFIFGLILVSGLITIIFASLASTTSHFVSHSLTSLKQALHKMDWLRIVAVGLFGVSGMTSQINVIIPNTIDISEANISFFLAGTKIISLLTAFLIGRYMQHKHYPKIMTYSIITSLIALAVLIWHYTITGYIIYMLIIAISAVFMNLSQGVLSNRREEYMKADKRAMTLIGETAIDIVRVGLSVVLLILGMHTVSIITGKVILAVFMGCLLTGAGLLARQGKKMKL